MDQSLKKGSKRVLIINYYWPPCGGVGVLRTLKFTKFLRQNGWEPIVFTAKNASYPSIDYSNEKDIPEGIEILREPILELHGLYNLLNRKSNTHANDIFYTDDPKSSLLGNVALWIRANFFIPDARALWIRRSVRRLKKYLRENPVDAIISSGPPNTNTRIATILKKQLGIPWIADWRDPWTQIDYYSSLPLVGWADQLHKKWEQEALKKANATTIVSNNWAEDLRKIGGQNIHVITNGYDPDDFSSIVPNWSEKFTVTHLGLLGSDRLPNGLIEAAGELVKEDEAFANNFQLQLIGQVSPQLTALAKANGLSDNQLHLTGNVNRDQAINFAAGSDVNLLLLNKRSNAKGRIPFKTFEYLAAKRPILAMGPTDSDVASILAKTEAGNIYAYDDKENIKKFLFNSFKDYRNKRQQIALVEANLKPFQFQELTARMAKLLDEIT